MPVQPSDTPSIHEYRCGFIAIIGRPNVGKSTLINALLHQKVAAASPRPQTTRRRQLGILTRPEAQLVLVDTPGVHDPRHKLGEFMNDEAEASLAGADIVLWLVDVSVDPAQDDVRIAEILRDLEDRPPVVLGLNKVDLADGLHVGQRLRAYSGLAAEISENVPISSTRGDGLDTLVDILVQRSPPGPAQYDEDQITDLYEREIAADLVRESALRELRHEVPHELGVRIEEYKERDSRLDYIRATLLVERNSQKGIVLGEGGRMLKRIGSGARKEIESMTGRRAFLELKVKVEQGWRNRTAVLEQLGYRKRR
jgi:GTP-binding protein Era